MRNLSVFISNLDLDFAQVIELFLFKFYTSNLEIYSIMYRKSCKQSLCMLSYNIYLLKNMQKIWSDRMTVR